MTLNTQEMNQNFPTCQYSECKKPGTESLLLPHMQQAGPFGGWKKTTNLQEVHACEYHFYILGGAGQFGLVTDPDGTIVVIGPYDLVRQIESVMGAREITKMRQPKSREALKKTLAKVA